MSITSGWAIRGGTNEQPLARWRGTSQSCPVATRYRQPRCGAQRPRLMQVRGSKARSFLACTRTASAVRQVQRKVNGTAVPGEIAARCSHNAAFFEVAAFTALRFVRCNDRCAPFGFAERGVMSCAPARLPRLSGAPDGANIWSGLRCALVPHLLPRFAGSQIARKNKRTATTTRRRAHRLACVLAFRQHNHRFKFHAKSTATPTASASGARQPPAMHRTCQRVFFSRRQGYATPLRALDGMGDGGAQRTRRLKEKHIYPPLSATV